MAIVYENGLDKRLGRGGRARFEAGNPRPGTRVVIVRSPLHGNADLRAAAAGVPVLTVRDLICAETATELTFEGVAGRWNAGHVVELARLAEFDWLPEDASADAPLLMAA